MYQNIHVSADRAQKYTYLIFLAFLLLNTTSLTQK